LGQVGPHQKNDKMKVTKFTHLLAVGLTLSLAAVGCHNHKPQQVQEIPGSTAGGGTNDLGNTGGMGDTNSASGGIPANPAGSHANWTEDSATLKADSVYFAYDSAEIRSSEKSKVSAVADYLKSNPAAAVRVEGNCDERGTEEYNRALGDRRASKAREELVALGIEASRVDTISYGKDRPVDTNNTDEGHSKNRRDDFVVLTKP
jgi:peptidoglycan-associated lipoprotein